MLNMENVTFIGSRLKKTNSNTPPTIVKDPSLWVLIKAFIEIKANATFLDLTPISDHDYTGWEFETPEGKCWQYRHYINGTIAVVNPEGSFVQ